MRFKNAKENENPICPFCKKELDEVLIKKYDRGFMRVSAKVIFCPWCKSVLTINRDMRY